eukprot:Rhum_TRINITY_DN16889_c0_g1::Rhum_TRINITY_DN16889_c0_g1_i1::g.164710::m.164710
MPGFFGRKRDEEDAPEEAPDQPAQPEASAQEEPAQVAEGDPDKKVGIRAVLVLVWIMRIVAVLSTVCVLVMYAFLSYEKCKSSSVLLAKVLSVLSTAFYVALCVCIVLTEIELKLFLYEFSFMYTWPGRGLCQLFVAVDFMNSKEQVKMVAFKLDSDLQDTIAEIAGTALITTGAAYLLMGVLCMRGLADTTDAKRVERKNFEAMLHSRKKKVPASEQPGTAAADAADTDSVTEAAGAGAAAGVAAGVAAAVPEAISEITGDDLGCTADYEALNDGDAGTEAAPEPTARKKRFGFFSRGAKKDGENADTENAAE